MLEDNKDRLRNNLGSDKAARDSAESNNGKKRGILTSDDIMSLQRGASVLGSLHGVQAIFVFLLHQVFC
jgi:hypothetical protein